MFNRVSGDGDDIASSGSGRRRSSSPREAWPASTPAAVMLQNRSRRADSRATRAFMDEDGDGDSRVEEEEEKGKEEEEGGGYCLQLMRRNWARYHGTPNGIGVDWKRWSLETLERVAGGLGGAGRDHVAPREAPA